MKNSANAPALVGAAVAVVALVLGLFSFAQGHSAAGVVAVVVAAAVGAGSAAWLTHTHRKVRDAERDWHAAHSDEPAPPPTS